MSRAAYAPESMPPALVRLAGLAPLGAADMRAVAAAAAVPTASRVRGELVREGEEVAQSRLLLSGWAARVRILADGRRQFLSFLLPGDLIGSCRHPRPLAVASVTALTDVTWCWAPDADALPGLAGAYAVSHAMDEAHLLGHVARLGRLSAQERIADLMLELHDRLNAAGLALRGGFHMPLTQEVLADALGLTSVHVNRMLQLMRRDGDLQWRQGRLTLPDPVALARKVGRQPVRVTALE